MSDVRIPKSLEAELEFVGGRIKDFLQCRDYNDGAEIIKSLIDKDVDIDPEKLTLLFGGGYINPFKDIQSFITSQMFETLKSVVEELRLQGVYIPYSRDLTVIDDRHNFVIFESSFHPLGKIPITKHNILEIHRSRKEDWEPELGWARRIRLEEEAKIIHASWEGRRGWLPWGEAKPSSNYQHYARHLAKESIDKQELEEIKPLYPEIFNLNKEQ